MTFLIFEVLDMYNIYCGIQFFALFKMHIVSDLALEIKNIYLLTFLKKEVRVYGCQNEGVFIKATKSFKKAVLNQKLHKTPKN